MTSAISSTTSSSSATSSSSSAASASTGIVNQSQFLQLLVAQMKNQDPTNPIQGTEYVTQLAQFSLVEQSVNQSSALSTMSSQLSGLSNEQATSLVGQTVTLNGTSVSYDGNTASPASVTLGGPASDVTATVSDSSGNVIRTIDMGAQPAGVCTVQWDGRSDAGAVEPSGSYSISVSATNSAGASVSVQNSVTGIVKSISYANGYPELTLANGVEGSVGQLQSVGQASSSSSTTSGQ